MNGLCLLLNKYNMAKKNKNDNLHIRIIKVHYLTTEVIC